MSSQSALELETNSSGAEEPSTNSGTASFSYGSLTAETEYDLGLGAPGPVLKQTAYEYQWQGFDTYRQANLLNLPCTVTLFGPGTFVQPSSCTAASPAANQIAQTLYGYDANNGSPQGALGNKTSSTSWLKTGASPVTQMVFNSTGEPKLLTDPDGHKTSFAYQCSGSRLQSTTNALGQSTTYGYDCGTGLPTSVTDANGATTSWSYDSLRNLQSIQYPDNGSVTVNYNGYSNPLTVTSTTVATPDPSIVKKTIYDGLGNPTQTQLTSDSSGIDYVDTTYDGLERVASVSNPYRSKNDPTYGITSYVYDGLGRITTQCQPDSTATSTTACTPAKNWKYVGSSTTFTDEDNHTWKRTFDGLGRLAQVLEPDANNNPTLESDYQYDPLNNLLRVDQWGGPSGSGNTALCFKPDGTQASGQACERVRTFSYDELSRLSSSTNPEAGTIGYSYDGNSNVHTRTDARGTVTTYGYDALNRLTGKSYSDSTPTVSYTYDTPAAGWNFLDQASPKWTGVQQTNLVGRLSYESNGSSIVVYGYDLLGRKTLKSICTPSTCGTDHYDMHASYNLAGNLAFADRGLDAARNAASPGTGYYYGGLMMSYNPAAQLFSAQSDIADAAHPQFILSTLNYTPLGQVYTAELGQQYGQVSSYDKRNRMTDRSSINLNGNTVLADHWDYDAVGNLMDANDSGQGDFVYHYDTLNRVKDATIPPFTETYTYDPWGNQTAHTVAAGSSYQWAYMPTMQNRASNPGASYDASGNMLSDGLHTYTYDAESRVSGVTDQGVQYRYDPEGMRVATVAGGAVTAEYLYDMAGELVTTVNAQGQLVRTILRDDRGTHIGDSIGAAGSGGVRTEFRLVNQVGTLVANGDSQGNFVEGCLSGPFGDGQDCTPNYDYTETHFTDKLRDQESTLDYFGARYFNSILGRFTSPDWSSEPEAIPYADLMNPQSLNLYSYAGNNPASRVDKDGHCDSSGGNCSAWDHIAGAVGGVLNIVPGTVNIATSIVNVGISPFTSYQIPQIDLIQSDEHASATGFAAGEALQVVVPVGDAAQGAQILRNAARGVASETRVLGELNLIKNTEAVVSNEGRSIPDFQTNTTIGEIKDTQRVNNTRQLRIQKEAAQDSGRQHELHTGSDTKVSPNAASGTQVIRRSDLGPQ